MTGTKKRVNDGKHSVKSSPTRKTRNSTEKENLSKTKAKYTVPNPVSDVDVLKSVSSNRNLENGDQEKKRKRKIIVDISSSSSESEYCPDEDEDEELEEEEEEEEEEDDDFNEMAMNLKKNGLKLSLRSKKSPRTCSTANEENKKCALSNSSKKSKNMPDSSSKRKNTPDSSSKTKGTPKISSQEKVPEPRKFKEPERRTPRKRISFEEFESPKSSKKEKVCEPKKTTRQSLRRQSSISSLQTLATVEEHSVLDGIVQLSSSEEEEDKEGKEDKGEVNKRTLKRRNSCISSTSKLERNKSYNDFGTPTRTPRGSKETNFNFSLNSPLSTRASRRVSCLGRIDVTKLDFSEDSYNTPKKQSGRPKRAQSFGKREKSSEPVTPSTKIITGPPRTPQTPLEKARLSLHVSSVPESLPCREKEFTNIHTFLTNKLVDSIGGCMYISGVPGTGKTATVTQVIRKLQISVKEGIIPEFRFFEINGMRLADPRKAYVRLWQQIFDTKDKISAEEAQKKLDNYFSQNKSKTNTVLLVDELDLICTKKQDVVYNLLDWPTRTHSRLVVLTIANTMDMPERLLKGRVTSRLGLTRLTFLPYTHKQLEEIVSARLMGLNAFSTDAVRLVTRKVASVSGDARRALDICRRATELPHPDETVKICHIEQAIKEMTNSHIVKVIRSCSEMQKLFLRSISDVGSRSGLEEVEILNVIDHLLALCTLEGFTKPPISDIMAISNSLKCCRLIYSNDPEAGALQRLTLNVTQDDIHYALKAS